MASRIQMPLKRNAIVSLSFSLSFSLFSFPSPSVSICLSIRLVERINPGIILFATLLSTSRVHISLLSVPFFFSVMHLFRFFFLIIFVHLFLLCSCSGASLVLFVAQKICMITFYHYQWALILVKACIGRSKNACAHRYSWATDTRFTLICCLYICVYRDSL